jgi:hypothetical protein
MEVHHHSHSHGRKNWKAYFWEFFMLFLAVFCGFLAELQLEHYIEHQREKVYIQSMREDLEKDTTHLSFIVASFSNKINAIDTLIDYYPDLESGYPIPFFRNVKHLFFFEDLHPNDRTMQQLKNAGGMRLIRKKYAVDSIIEYDSRIKDALTEQDGINNLFHKMQDIGELLNVPAINSAMEYNDPENLQLTKTTILFTKDKSMLGKYNTWMRLFRQYAWYYVAFLEDTKAQASRLIDLLKKEYHLK